MVVEGVARTFGIRFARSAKDHCSSLGPSLHLKLRLANFVCAALPDFWSGRFRARLYRGIGFDIDASASVWGNVEFTSGLPGFYDKLSIGENSVVSTRVTMNLDGHLSIGSNVTIGPYVLIYTGSHRTGPESRRCEPEAIGMPVQIGNGCWIRVGAIILPGVTIGDGSIVAAGAVVSQDVAPNSYVEGNPARAVRELRCDRANARPTRTPRRQKKRAA